MQFLNYINKLEGWKTKCKGLHWSASDLNTHLTLDQFLKVISDYQDTIAEEIMGILQIHFKPDDLIGYISDAQNVKELIFEIKNETLYFYSNIPDNPLYSGIKSECETFIQNLNQYNYLFSLCNGV